MISRFFMVAVVALAPTIVPATVASAKPFKAKLTGTAAPDFSGFPVVSNEEVGVGNATHLGKFLWEDDETAIFTSLTHAVVTATFTMTAANGDKVFGTLSTEGDIVAGTLLIHGTYEITGGTGRFANATGSGELDAVAEPGPPFGYSGTFTGTLNY